MNVTKRIDIRKSNVNEQDMSYLDSVDPVGGAELAALHHAHPVQLLGAGVSAAHHLVIDMIDIRYCRYKIYLLKVSCKRNLCLQNQPSLKIKDPKCRCSSGVFKCESTLYEEGECNIGLRIT